MGCELDYDSLGGLSGAGVWVSTDESMLRSTAAEYKEMRLR
jgi:hypothetical protein